MRRPLLQPQGRDSVATAMPHTLRELLGQFDLVQRSLILIHVVLEQGTDQLYISPILATCVKRSIPRIYHEMQCGPMGPYGGPE